MPRFLQGDGQTQVIQIRGNSPLLRPDIPPRNPARIQLPNVNIRQIRSLFFADIDPVTRKPVHRLPRPDQKCRVVPADIEQDRVKLLQGQRHKHGIVVKTDSRNKESEQNHRCHQRNEPDSRRPNRLQFQVLGHPTKDNQRRHQNTPRHREGQGLRHQQADHFKDQRERHLIIHQQLKNLFEGVPQHDDEGKHRHRAGGGRHHLAG